MKSTVLKTALPIMLAVSLFASPVVAYQPLEATNLEHATAVQIERNGETTLLTITDPWPKGPEIRYAFVPEGSAAATAGSGATGGQGTAGTPNAGGGPDSSGRTAAVSGSGTTTGSGRDTASGASGSGRDTASGASGSDLAPRWTIPVPVQRVVSMSTTALPHLEALGAGDTVVAVDNKSYIYNGRIRAAIDRGDVQQVGSGAELNLERIIASDPDIVVTSIYAPDDPVLERIEGAGIPVLVLADWREQDPLGRAEWIKVFGILLDRRSEASELFRTTARHYEELAELTTGLRSQDLPSVMLNAPWQGSWAVPAGDSYVARLFDDAGANYIWADTGGTGSTFLDLETVLAQAGHSDYWFHLNFGWTSRSDATDADPRLAAFQPYKTGNMYHYNRRTRPEGANDFWESGAARPDIVLADLIHILHPDLLPRHDLYFYRRVDQ